MVNGGKIPVSKAKRAVGAFCRLRRGFLVVNGGAGRASFDFRLGGSNTCLIPVKHCVYAVFMA